MANPVCHCQVVPLSCGEATRITVMLNFAVVAPPTLSHVGLDSPMVMAGSHHHVHHHPHVPPSQAQPPGQCKRSPWLPPVVQQVSNTPSGEGTSLGRLQLITCKAPAPFTETPFREPWEISNKFAVGWRREASVNKCTYARRVCVHARLVYVL